MNSEDAMFYSKWRRWVMVVGPIIATVNDWSLWCVWSSVTWSWPPSLMLCHANCNIGYRTLFCIQEVVLYHLLHLCPEVAGRRQLRSASLELLDFPRFDMSNYGRRAFSFAGPHTWNLLPDQLRTSVSLATFKRSPTTFLFEQITHSAH